MTRGGEAGRRSSDSVHWASRQRFSGNFPTHFQPLQSISIISPTTMPWKTIRFIATLLVLSANTNAITIVHDTFADGDRTNQDLSNNSVALFKTRSGTTVTSNVGSVVFNPTGAAGSDM